MIFFTKILISVITIIFLVGAIGEKDNDWKTKYFFGTLFMSIILVIAVKCL